MPAAQGDDLFYNFELLSPHANHKIPVMPHHSDPAHIYEAISRGKDIHWWARTWIRTRWIPPLLFFPADVWWHQYPCRCCRLGLLIRSRRNILFLFFNAGNGWTDFQPCGEERKKERKKEGKQERKKERRFFLLLWSWMCLVRSRF